MPAPGTTLADVSEEALLAAILPLFAPHDATLVGPGDDAAVLRCGPSVVATTDSMVRGRDWLDEWSAPEDVGVKLVTQNLADVAAMGAVATSLLVTLAADPATTVDWAVGFARGLGEAAEEAGVAVAGGDLSSAPTGSLFVSVTAMGDLRGRTPVLRSGARPGDVVGLCGSLGRSAAGLLLLQQGRADEESETVARCLAHHRRPRAPLPAGPQAADVGATAMLDVSDGLLRDGHRIARASGVCPSLDDAALQACVSALEPAVGRALARECVLAGGEEHSLLATFPPGALPEGWEAVGRVTEGAGVSVDGVAEPARGWDHFAR